MQLLRIAAIALPQLLALLIAGAYFDLLGAVGIFGHRRWGRAFAIVLGLLGILGALGIRAVGARQEVIRGWRSIASRPSRNSTSALKKPPPPRPRKNRPRSVRTSDRDVARAVASARDSARPF